MKKSLLLIAGLILVGQIVWILITHNTTVKNSDNAVIIPDFSLPSLFEGENLVQRSDLISQNIRVVNFFASWCGPCKMEHPFLMDIKQKNIKIMGISFQDSQDGSLKFLNDKGNPYHLSAWDGEGKTYYNFGIESIPQTFIIDDKGHILYHRQGRIRESDMTNDILPLLKNIPSHLDQ
ncbi:MAG: DsbE family thiol:disulfide interchange protein [Emcibacter sp.]|nr:DsbE family thiol:disulfide interchange protein [Emcibacter sp.]